METLDAPVFEINPKSKVYQTKKEYRDSQKQINQLFKELGETYGFHPDEFAAYSSESFGLEQRTKSAEKFKSELRKNPDKNGIYLFLKTSKTYKELSPKLTLIDKVNELRSPWAMHEIFGINNAISAQWVEDRLFVQVKDKKRALDLKERRQRNNPNHIEEIMPIEYSEYLQIIVKKLEKEEKRI